MFRKFFLVATSVAASFGLVVGQTAGVTLDFQQFPGSNTIWLTPKAGLSIDEAAFFSQPGIANILTPADDITLLKSRLGEGGFTHKHYQQVHGGYPVEGAVMITHAMDGQLKSANGVLAYLPMIEEPAFNDAEAVMLVQAKLGVLGPVASEGEDFIISNVTLIYAPTTWETHGANLEYRLAYRVAMLVVEPFSSSIVYVDAHTGEVFRLESALQECSQGSALTLYNGWQAINSKYYQILGSGHFELRDDCRGELIHTRIDLHENADYDKFFKHSQCSDLKDGDNLWQDPGSDIVSASLHWAGEMFHDYLQVRLGRDGLDGAGCKMKLVYHPTLLRIRHYYLNGDPWFDDTLSPVNAYWDRIIYEAHFGKGDGISPMVSLDVVSHELTHGFISYEQPNLLTAPGQARALNESFGDIFGICSEWYNIPLHDPARSPNFTMGEDVALGPFRSIEDPLAFNLPSFFEGPNWDFGTNPDGHVNGAVQSYWFYLLAYGSWGKQTVFNIGVCGIGMDNAAQIAYRNITDYLGTASTFGDARQGSILAAEAEFGLGSNEALQCANAWAAVNVGQSASTCTPLGSILPNQENGVFLNTYPNPTTTKCTVSLHSPHRLLGCNLTVWSIQGDKVADILVAEVIQPGDYAWEIDCTKLSTGTYHLLFSTKQAQVCKRIVVLH